MTAHHHEGVFWQAVRLRGDLSAARRVSKVWGDVRCRLGAAFVFGVGTGTTLGLLCGRLRLGLIDGILLAIACMISASGLGRGSRDR